jgi:hypothetical protein
MTCSHCQAELPDSAATCPQCGTATQQGQPTTFSYLPAGTPPWPTTVPARLPHTLESPTATAGSVSSSKTEKPKRSLRSILLAVAILVLIPIIGSAFTLTNLYLSGDLLHSNAKKVKAPTNSRHDTAGQPVTCSYFF